MEDANIVIPVELLEHIQRRRALWQELEQSESERHDLRQLAAQIPPEVQAEAIAPLTSEATPASELYASVQGLRRSIAEVTQIQQAIQAAEREIDAINARFRTLVIGGVIGGISLLAILVASLLN